MLTPAEQLGRDYQVVAFFGLQWGDEGKGRYVDLLVDEFDLFVRANGGNNAGHSFRDMIAHLVPTGVFSGKPGVIGPGVVVDPLSLVSELEELKKRNIPWDQLYVSGDAAVVTPDRIFLDHMMEFLLGKDKIGTTGRGIGPTYGSYVERYAVRMNDLVNKDFFAENMRRNLGFVKRHFIEPYMADDDVKAEFHKIMHGKRMSDGIFYSETDFFDLDAIIDRYMSAAFVFSENIRDTRLILDQAYTEGQRIVLEAGQGMLLSFVHGSYPDVTSSSMDPGWLACGAGIPAGSIDKSYGIFRMPVMNRVGSGPFPTEFGGERSREYCDDHSHSKELEMKTYPDPVAMINGDDELMKGIGYRIISNNYGATTKRPRRTGWLDLVALKHAIRVSINRKKDAILATHIDDCDQADQVNVCTEYGYFGPERTYNGRTLKDGDIIKDFPTDARVLACCKPFYCPLKGWKESTRGLRKSSDVPENLIVLSDRLESSTGARIEAISVGPEPDELVYTGRQ
ncbi:MAG: adenylosuccinate synthetase [Candidatus Woesearchaeota archaeon]